MSRKSRPWTAADQAALAEAVSRHQAGDLAGAVAGYHAVIARHPRHDGAHALLGAAHLQSGCAAAAAAEFRAALSAGARDPEIHNNYALALRALGRNREAVRALERAVAARPDFAEALLNLGNALKACGRVDEASGAFRRAAEVDPEFAPAHVALGNLHASLGDRDAALGCYHRALDADPDDVNAFYHLALTAKAAVDTVDTATLRRFRERVAREGVGEETALGNFAIGVLADRVSRYDEAFAHFSAANEAMKAVHRARGDGFDAAKHSAQIDRLIAAFPASIFTARAGAGRASGRPIFIVGMPRSGTTLVEEIIDRHPDAFGAGELEDIPRLASEIVDYPAGVASLDRRAVARLADRYLAALGRLAPGVLRVCDKRPTNFMHLGLIALLFRGARVVHCRRDPLDTALSCYFQNFTSGIRFANDLGDIAAYYLDYRRLMDHWRAVLPIDSLEIDYETLVNDTERVTRELIDFAGLPWNDACLRPGHGSRLVASASNLQVREPVYDRSVGRWRDYERHLGRLRDALAGFTDQGISEG